MLENSTYTGKTSVKARFAKRRDVVDTTLINPIDLNQDRAIGILLPFGNNSNDSSGYDNSPTKSNLGGTPPTTSGNNLFRLSYLTKDQVISNVRNLILTNKGERLMNPEFGTDIYRLLFDQNTLDLEPKIRESVQNAFDKYMPLAKIEFLEVNQHEHKIHIILGFSVIEYNISEIIEITTGVA